MGQHPNSVLLMRPGDRQPGPPTAGMVREAAFTSAQTWSGLARTEPGMVSGWHHHGEYDSIIYVLSGALHIEFGPAGTDTVHAEPGDFVLVPRATVHRESNPSVQPAEMVVVRFGSGESIFNVSGPAAS
ncbi:cupin domain-containing protein [Hamadaea sp. NPDC050747]|uniref:cupin domain-containing protein n=1 Tax=Hamadaea sp. NPDC050747 TaxID=3155789 RepID=UPI0033F5B85F